MDSPTPITWETTFKSFAGAVPPAGGVAQKIEKCMWPSPKRDLDGVRFSDPDSLGNPSSKILPTACRHRWEPHKMRTSKNANPRSMDGPAITADTTSSGKSGMLYKMVYCEPWSAWPIAGGVRSTFRGFIPTAPAKKISTALDSPTPIP